MGVSNELWGAIATESRRIEEDVLFSSRGHFEAAARWSRVHFYLGLPASVLACVAGALAFGGETVAAGILAGVVTALTAVLTFLNPNEKANVHHVAGTRFNALRNQSRIFCQVDLLERNDISAARQRLAELADLRDGQGWCVPRMVCQACLT